MTTQTPRVVAVIQARMGSTRLPGKVLAELSGRPVLGWVLRAVAAAVEVDDVVVATTTDPADNPVAYLAERLGAGVVRGSEADVLSRYVLAAKQSRADAVVRITSDCPLLDPRLIDQLVSTWRSDPRTELVATTLVRTFPRGLDVELVSTPALLDVDQRADGFHRTHVTSFLYAPGTGYRSLGIVTAPPANDLRVTLDTEADLEALRQLTAELGDRAPSWREVVELLRARPDIATLNANVEQKRLEEG